MQPQKEWNDTSILLIDGECMLCSKITRFVVKRDRKRRFRFAALQSPAGQRLLSQGGLPLQDFNTFVLVENGRYRIKSTGALHVLRGLGGLWPLLYAFMIVPPRWRNLVYDWIAGSRYKWFGKTDVCMLPGKEVLDRFLQDGLA